MPAARIPTTKSSFIRFPSGEPHSRRGRGPGGGAQGRAARNPGRLPLTGAVWPWRTRPRGSGRSVGQDRRWVAHHVPSHRRATVAPQGGLALPALPPSVPRAGGAVATCSGARQAALRTRPGNGARAAQDQGSGWAGPRCVAHAPSQPTCYGCAASALGGRWLMCRVPAVW